MVDGHSLWNEGRSESLSCVWLTAQGAGETYCLSICLTPAPGYALDGAAVIGVRANDPGGDPKLAQKCDQAAQRACSSNRDQGQPARQ